MYVQPFSMAIFQDYLNEIQCFYPVGWLTQWAFSLQKVMLQFWPNLEWISKKWLAKQKIKNFQDNLSKRVVLQRSSTDEIAWALVL